MASTTQHSPRLQDAAAAVTTITTSPDATAVKRKRRKSRQAIIEEELWQLRLRTFVKSESLRLNTSLSPRSQLTFDESDDDDDGGEGGTNLKNRQWRRSNKRHNGNNFIEKMRDAARNARVFQLRIAGRRSWWPASSGPTSSAAIPLTPSTITTLGARQNDNRGVLKCCNDDRETYKQKKKDKRELVALTTSIDKLLLEGDSVNRNQMSITEKRHQQEGTINSSSKKKKFEWKFWKKTGKENDIDETTSVDGDTVQSSATNTAYNNNSSGNNNKDNILLDDDSAIMEIAEKIDTEEKKMKQKIVAAVATTSVSSLGVALAIILL
jgi:hypothetical protein